MFKLNSPCNLCRGESKTACIICGWRKRSSPSKVVKTCRNGCRTIMERLECIRCGPCIECKGLSKTVCKECGWTRPRKMDLTPMELIQFDGYEERVKDLRLMKRKLTKFNMESTGSTGVDDAIIDEVGDWRDASNQ